ncbi:MAG: CPBP family intramembrane metalloprotease, partial [Candidatus Aminicenantes bacterium]
AFLFALAVVWTTAAFGEEMIFRGFFLNRLARLGRRRPFSWMIALLFSSVFFGLGHAYQGVAGVVLTALAGLFFGLIYLACRQNLWVPILVHGLYDTTAFLILFLNLDH